jgi:pSer/pThr/pTyr-binding forkhead associated (FHA) protein
MSRRLIVLSGSDSREFVLVGTMIVGRDPACDISDAADPLLSRRHAEFSNANDATVRDLGSRNGILVNGVKTPRAVLHGGDVVQVGHLQVKFVDEIGPFTDVLGAQPDAAPALAESDKPTVVIDLVDRPTVTPDLDVTRKLPS